MSRVDRSEVRALAGYTTGRPGRRDVYDSLAADTITTSAITVFNVLHGYVKADSDALPSTNVALPDYSDLKDEIKKMVPGLAVRFYVENTGSLNLTLVPGAGGSADGSMLAPSGEKTTFALRIDSLTAYTVFRLQHSSSTGSASGGIWEHATDAATGSPIARLDAANPSYSPTEAIVCPAQGMNGTGAGFFVDVPAGGAIRAGSRTGGQWDDVNRGPGTAVFGTDNQATGDNSSVAGGKGSKITSTGAFIGAGTNHSIEADLSCIVGGENNVLNERYGIIGGGMGGIINLWSTFGAILGGENNIIGVLPGEIVASTHNFIGGGQENRVGATTVATHGVVGGGFNNAITRNHSVIAGGQSNVVDSELCFIGGGGGDNVTTFPNTIETNQPASVVVGGTNNHIYSNANTGGRNAIGGGSGNFIGVSGGIPALSNNVIAGGRDNRMLTLPTGVNDCGDNFIGGGHSNRIDGDVSLYFNVLVGGTDNTMLTLTTETSTGNFLGGGESNTIDGARGIEYSVLAGGFNNAIGYSQCVVAGGQANACSGGAFATISGGSSNVANGQRAAIGGGSENAAGTNACVPGGVGAIASQAGQVASANGYFAAAGDAQGTMQIVSRIQNDHGTAANADLYVDGIATPFYIASNSSYTVDVLLSGLTANGAQGWSYEIQANVRTDAAGTVTINAAPTNAIFTSDATYTAALVTSGANQWNVQAQYGGGGTAYTIRWVAVARTSEATFP